MLRNNGTNATAGGEFTDGDVGLGIPRSILGSAWTNMIQRELRAVAVAGGIDPEGVAEDLVAQAIRNLGFSTGDAKITLKTAADSGWIMANDGTIGSATSGATTRANADAEPLYTILWNNVSNTYAPVTGGRGASAAADFAANKPIALTKMLGRALAVGGAGSGLTSRALGETAGAETHVLTIAEMPAHTHTVAADAQQDPGSGAIADGNADAAGTVVNTGSTGSGGAHNNMQPSSFMNVMIKL